MKMNKSLFFIISLLFFSCNSFAQSKRCIISSSGNINFSPREVFVIIQHKDSATPLRGTLIPLSGKNWMIGSFLSVDKFPHHIKASFIVIGEKNEIFTQPPQEFTLTENLDRCLSADELKVKIQEISEEAKKEQKATSAAELQLKRIRGDVDLIADIGEIVGVKEERLNIESQLKALARDKEALEKAFKLVRNLGNPKNFTRREAELLNQIPSIAEIASQAERSELIRQQQVSGGLQQHLGRIKAASGLDINQLQDKLIGLRAYRAELERERGIQ